MLFERRTSSAERPLQLPLMADFETDPVASKGAKGLIGQQSGGTPVLRRLLVEMWDQAPAHALNARAPSRSITVAMDRALVEVQREIPRGRALHGEIVEPGNIIPQAHSAGWLPLW
jgi:hypothetical protein